MGRITAAQKANLNDLDLYKTKIKDLKNKNVVLDIGFGNGEYTAAYANAFQEKHLIATEVYLSGIGSFLFQINRPQLQLNVFLEKHLHKQQCIRHCQNQYPRQHFCFLSPLSLFYRDLNHLGLLFVQL